MQTFNFSLLDSAGFKEDSVREFIISPLLKALGFVLKIKNANKLEMALSVPLSKPTITGSNEKITFTRFPDYVLYLDKKAHCVLDAKAPSVKVDMQSKAERQAFYYAINAELKAPYYALCNGKNFNLFETNGQNLLYDFVCEELFENDFDNDKFKLLKQVLSTGLSSLKQDLQTQSVRVKKPDSWYLSRKLPKAILKPQKRKKARHFGCTAYFTRQSWDIVTQNIKNFTDEGDVVLDSFGGSGVTAIEAMMNRRFGIHTDLNPLSIFMVKALSAKVNLGELYEVSEEILSEFEKLRPKDENEAKQILKNAKYYPNAIDKEFGEIATQKEQDKFLWIPQNEVLPKGSDVEFVLQLFTKKQIAELAILRKLIFQYTFKDRKILKELRYSLMLAFYNTITRCNLTFHYADSVKSAGDSGIYKYYRYRIAPKPAFLDIGEHFRGKTQRVLKGKEELEKENGGRFYQSYFAPLQRVIKDFSGALIAQRSDDLEHADSMLDKTNGEKIFQADATNLKEIESESIDFIYTDPPYGAKIPYLDLSTMWNVWLDLPVDRDLKEKECIEKGSLEKNRYDYYDLMKQSLKEMYRVLKWNRWLAFVFQHQDPKLFQILVESAENVGFEYVACISQENTGIDSFRKVQNPTRVLKGQLIIYFKKIDNPKTRTKLEAGEQSLEQMYKDVEKIIVDNNGASLEAIHAHLVKNAIEGGYYELMAKFENVVLLINERFDYDEHTKLYHIRSEASILNYTIPIEERARYYILGELMRAKKENRSVSFDKFLSILPLLKNGVQANDKMIKDILNDLAYEDKDMGTWRLKEKKGTQGSLF
ncbi:DNA methyltransferase [uncultured Helicobacter sp.]|uniref:DNA methyltransferase n=2 Tax=uncultured Helicobacter sp. TaxID=175537 RepID=UPI00262B8798|nr:DNA methyltransferase [uncultured Helicobacter sp.]